MKFEMHFKPNTVKRQFALYIMKDNSNSIYHVGVCQLDQVLNTPDARRIPQFDGNQFFTIEVHAPFTTKAEALQLQYQIIKNNGGTTILRRQSVTQVKPLILCNETGQVFAKQMDACKEFGIHQSALSVALNMEGRRCGGFTFKQIPCHDPHVLARLRMGEALTIKDLGGPQHA